MLRALRLIGVSSQPGASAEPWLATLPAAMTDGEPSTFWSEAKGGGGRGEFATFTWDGSGYDMRALAIVPVPAGLTNDRAVSVARSLWLVGESGARNKLSEGVAKLKPYQPAHHGIFVNELIGRAERILEDLDAGILPYLIPPVIRFVEAEQRHDDA